jgi:hypothetical protein
MVNASPLLRAVWKKVKRNRFELEELLDDKEYWISNMDIIEEYEKGTSTDNKKQSKIKQNKSKLWYLESNYIDNDHAEVVRKDLNTYFPDLSE